MGSGPFWDEYLEVYGHFPLIFTSLKTIQANEIPNDRLSFGTFPECNYYHTGHLMRECLFISLNFQFKFTLYLLTLPEGRKQGLH